MFRNAISALNSSADYQTDCSGSQLSVSRFGEPLLDVAIGVRDNSCPLTRRTQITWVCCGKALITLALCQILAEQGITADALVCDLVPEFGRNGKENVALAHVLTHTVPYRAMGRVWDGSNIENRGEHNVFVNPWDDALNAICEEPLAEEPGTRVVYLSLANWLLLAEIIQRLDGMSYEESISTRVLKPLGMTSTSIRMSQTEALHADRAALLSLNDQNVLVPMAFDEPELADKRWPGVNSRGPAGDLIKLVECAAGWRSKDLLAEEWREKITQPWRTGLPDPIFMGASTSWSLGFCVDPISFGLGSKIRVVGQTGVRSSMVFADLSSGVSIAFIASRMISPAQDWTRKRKVVRAVYKDLSLPVA